MEIRRSCLLALLVLYSPGCNSVSPTAPALGASNPGETVARPAFKAMTYNVQLGGFSAPDAEARKPLIVEIIRSEAADIIGLQEIAASHQADLEVGLQDLYDFYGGASGGNLDPILVRKGVFAVANQGSFTFSTGCGGLTGATFLELQSPRGVSFVVFNSHLCFGGAAENAIELVDMLARMYPGVPAIVMGDLNAGSGSDTMNFLLAQGELAGSRSPLQLYDTWVLAGLDRGVTRVGTGIDWILTSDGTGVDLDVLGASVVQNASGASDHTPITATLF